VDRVILPVNVLVEGYTDEAVVRRILGFVGLPCGTVYGKNGKSSLLANLPKYNQAALHFGRWLTVVDLDRDADCAPDYVREILTSPAERMCVRVAVRALESWMLGDAEHLAKFLGIPLARIPQRPDVEENPKRVLVDLARRSRKRAIREDMVPRPGSGSQVGPGYTGRLIEFVAAADHPWRPSVAMQRSDSLRRCLDALTVWGGAG
jgi:hypothetical protein